MLAFIFGSASFLPSFSTFSGCQQQFIWVTARPPFCIHSGCLPKSHMLVSLGQRSAAIHMRKAKPLEATISSARSEYGLFFTAQLSAFAKEKRYPVLSKVSFQVMSSFFMFLLIPPN